MLVKLCFGLLHNASQLKKSCLLLFYNPTIWQEMLNRNCWLIYNNATTIHGLTPVSINTIDKQWHSLNQCQHKIQEKMVKLSYFYEWCCIIIHNGRGESLMNMYWWSTTLELPPYLSMDNLYNYTFLVWFWSNLPIPENPVSIPVYDCYYTLLSYC